MTIMHARFLGPVALCAVAALTPTLILAQTQDMPPVHAFVLKASPIATELAAPDSLATQTWASGSTYKVSFHDGMVFHPYVGPSLPHQPLRWRTSSVRAGGAELLVDTATPTPRHTDFRCEYDLGAVVECYDVRDGGVEQSFVVKERPPAGDLVITGEITSPLRIPAKAAAHGAVSLHLPDGRSVIDYGAAVLIDSNGVRTPITTATEGNRIVLRVAAATVAAARFPVVVDPLISTSSLLGIGAQVKDVDVLYETLSAPGLQGRTWYSWVTEVAAGDDDLRLWRVGTNWSGTAFQVHRSIGVGDAKNGRLALAPAANRVVLVYSVDLLAELRVVLHRHDVSDVTLNQSGFFVPQPTGASDWRPDVGGRLEPSGSKVLIVFQREAVDPFVNTNTSTIHATVFDAALATTPFVVAPFVVLTQVDTDQERCVVNQSSDTGDWLVAFQQLRNGVTNDLWRIKTVAIDVAGTVTDTGLATAQAASPLLHNMNPQIAGAFGRYVLTYSTRAFELPNPRPSTVDSSALHAQRLDFDHTTDTGSFPHPEVSLQTTPGNSLTNGGLAFDPVSQSHWCSGFEDATQGRYRVSKLGYTGNILEQLPINLRTGASPASIAVGFMTGLRQFPIVYADNIATGGEVLGTTMQYMTTTPPVLSGLACGSGVWAGVVATGDRQQLGSEDMPVRLTNAPVDTFALVIASLSPINADGALIGAPTCTILPDLAVGFIDFFFAPIVGGEASLTFDLPESLGPFPLYLQWAYATPGINPLGFQFSEGLTLQVDR